MEFIKFKGQRRYGELFTATRNIDKDFNSASPPSVFVGSNISQKVLNIGILSPPERIEQAWIYDSPKYWYERKYGINEIASLRASLVNSKFKANVLDARKDTKLLDIAKEITMTLKPVDLEINLEKKPHNENRTLDKISFPSGPIAKLKNVRITSNTKINQRIDKIYNDDLKATEAIEYLNKHNFDEHTLSKLLSLGIFGLKKNRRLVPTRWSITCLDSTLGNHLLEKIKYKDIINEYRLFYGNYFGNYYLIMLFPEQWSYELFEAYLPGAVWNFSGKIEVATDYESIFGRKSYVKETAGGYFGARLPILEYLNREKRQASALVLRFETPEYTKPLGVFVVRQAARKTLNMSHYKFNTKEEMIKAGKEIIFRKFKYKIDSILKQSKLLKSLNQLKLNSFLKN